MKTKVVLLVVTRSLASAPARVVLEHEIPILKVIHGAGAVLVTDENCKGYELRPTEVKPRDELIRLKQKYKSFIKDGQHPVDTAFPDGSRDLELYYKSPETFAMVGEEAGGGALDEGEEEILNDEGAPVASEPEEIPEVPVANPGINLNDRPAVMAKLEELGVPFAKTTQTKHLASLLTKSLEIGAAE